MEALDRRAMLAVLAGCAALPWFGARAIAAPAAFTMWRDPGCGCCTEWARRVEGSFGRKLQVIDVPNMATIKRAQAVPADLQSCHTALISGLVIEGHVPPADIRKALSARNRTYKGLAVPGMPAGSPGMDIGHDHRESYTVFAFSGDGARSVFATRG